jgi:ankyrin repeat protein
MSQLSSVAKQPLKKCAGCGKEGAGFKHCGGCLSVFYCSSACQSTSWAGHKAACKEIRLQRIKEGCSGVGDIESTLPTQMHQPQPRIHEDWEIFNACCEDHRAELQKVLQQSGLDVNWAIPAAGWTAAHVASKKGHGECLSIIIRYGADLSKLSKNGLAPIHEACKSGRIGCLSLLLDNGVGVNVRVADALGLTPVMICSMAGHVKCLALLLDRKADPDLSCRFGVTAAHQACTFGQVKCLQLLIARRANINARDDDGQTPLDYARGEGHTECVERLLANHAVGKRAEDVFTASESNKVRSPN